MNKTLPEIPTEKYRGATYLAQSNLRHVCLARQMGSPAYFKED